jgi:hypothetical protein
MHGAVLTFWGLFNGSHETQDIKTEFYTLPNPGAYTVQIRVRADLLNLASAWSTPKRFGE